MNKHFARFQIRHLAFSLLVLLGAVSSAHSQTTGREALLQTIPHDFKIGYKVSNPKMTMTEMVPKNETVEDWSEMVTTQVFFNAPISPPDFLRNMGAKWMGACPGSTHGALNSGIARGYPVSMLLLACPKNPSTGKPETVLIRAIQGKTTLYVVQYAFRTEANSNTIDKAARYLADVNVYAPESTDTPLSDQKESAPANKP